LLSGPYRSPSGVATGPTLTGPRTRSAAILAMAACLAASAARGQPADVATEVARGCRVREQSAFGFQFRATREWYPGRAIAAIVLEDGGRADEIGQLTGGAEGARSRFVELHRVTAEEWEVEARCSYWGGSDGLFSADLDREPTSVGDLHMKRLCRPNVTLAYRSGPKPSHAMGDVQSPRYTWENASSPCAEYVGLHFRGLGRFSEFIDTMVQDGARVTSEAVTQEGHEGVRLELRWAPRKGAWHVLKLGFVRLDGYAPFSAERLSVTEREGEPETLVRTTAEWSDFAQVPAGPWIPCSYRYASYSTDERGVLALTAASVVRIDRSSVAAAEGRLSDAELGRWFPLGTHVAAPPIAKQELAPEVVDAMTRDNAGASTTESWVASPLEKLVPWMDDPLFTAAPEERKRLADQLRVETRRQAQQGK